ncbi:MAG: site-specific DNA-methyltransferase [Proteobacteria bacterium]|nr:site-specific DNA-methyltransferase [Pseudomonadota bacterium]
MVWLRLHREALPVSSKQRLELTWIGKDQRPKLEPRILLEDASRSYHAPRRVAENDLFDNRLIFGDNLLALKALEQEFAGKVKCVAIDPPYNTGSAFEHYDDGVEHSVWLSLMRDRLEIIRGLLSDDGSVWITIDDNEAHYLKIVLDEIFGRQNYVTSVIWQKLHARNNTAQHFSADHDYLLVYARDLTRWRRNKVSRTGASDADFWNPDGDPRGDWRRSDLTASKPYADGKYEVTGPHGDVFTPRANRWWGLSESSFIELIADNRIWWGKSGRTFPFRKRFRSELGDLVPTTVWLNEEVGNNREAKQEVTRIFSRDDIFSTPKPERLLERVLAIATNPGDLVLDSFAGSGTTGAVAHKMGRRWIMVELGEHCHTHIIPRLKKVIDGDDPGGVTASTGWQGGGGFRYYRLAPSLLQQDRYGQWVVNKEYNAEMLSAALCKLEGFTYAPHEEHYWQQGYSSEQDFIYVTTQTLSAAQLRALSDEVGASRSLLVCCGAFRGDAGQFENLTVKKIPKMLLKKCEWGHDDYSLNVANLPAAPTPEPARQPGLFDAPASK